MDREIDFFRCQDRIRVHRRLCFGKGPAIEVSVLPGQRIISVASALYEYEASANHQALMVWIIAAIICELERINPPQLSQYLRKAQPEAVHEWIDELPSVFTAECIEMNMLKQTIAQTAKRCL